MTWTCACSTEMVECPWCKDPRCPVCDPDFENDDCATDWAHS